MCKPDGLPYLPEIMNLIHGVGLEEVESSVRFLTDEDIAFLYQDQQKAPHYDAMCQYLQREKVRLSVLASAWPAQCAPLYDTVYDTAVNRLRRVLGDRSPWLAGRGTIRQRFSASRKSVDSDINGTTENAYHGSANLELAQAEIAYFFPNFEFGD
jgi:nucleoside diphosphate kinase